MPDAIDLRYWDSCVFLSYINGHPARLPTIDAILLEVRRSKGTKGIVTSVFSVAEVAFGAQEQQQQALDPAVEKRIDDLWQDESVVKLSEFHELIALEARAIMRMALVKGWSLKGKDAVHLATARFLKVKEFNTYDAGLFKYGPDLGFPIQPPTTQQQLLLPPSSS
jgi:predicted nucleic acid-binding protein